MHHSRRAADLTGLVFDNSFTRELPGDPSRLNEPRQVFGACYSRVEPVRVSAPRLVAYSAEVAEDLGLGRRACTSDDFTQVFSGNKLLSDMDAHATCYGGHQFGQWAGQLGDGRAINLGEVVNPGGDRSVLQLKGAGPTPYSRSGDGLAVLRSSIREFLCSEAMHHLGVPTTRALSLALTGERVPRDMFYDGHPEFEPGAVVCRVAQSFTRFGSFEIFAARGETEVLRRLADYTIRTDFPHLGDPSGEVYLAWFEEVCRTTAEMIVHWTRVGFVHGVMNTDNMSILGLTIDYGPYGWVEDFDLDWTPNTTDAVGRRYRFGNQARIALWNLTQFANAIYPLIGDAPRLEDALGVYGENFERGLRDMWAKKLGFSAHEGALDAELIDELTRILELVETDMTIFFRRLATGVVTNGAANGDDDFLRPFVDAYYVPDQLTAEYRARFGGWLNTYRERLLRDGIPDDVRRDRMNSVNPKYVLRNYLAQLAIDEAQAGEFSLVQELLELFRNPYDEQPGMDEKAAKRPDWARDRPGCSMLSCSS